MEVILLLIDRWPHSLGMKCENHDLLKHKYFLHFYLEIWGPKQVPLVSNG